MRAFEPSLKVRRCQKEMVGRLLFRTTSHVQLHRTDRKFLWPRHMLESNPQFDNPRFRFRRRHSSTAEWTLYYTYHVAVTTLSLAVGQRHAHVSNDESSPAHEEAWLGSTEDNRMQVRRWNATRHNQCPCCSSHLLLVEPRLVINRARLCTCAMDNAGLLVASPGRSRRRSLPEFHH